jgi:phosphatidylserine/phosphatidylglycerophosphate/cardiolipin synthase-like enzyme
MPEADALQLAVVRAARTLPGDQLDQLANALDEADGPSAALRVRTTSLVATDVFGQAVAEILDAWSGGDALDGSAVALALRASAEAARAERDEEEIEIVWTGPTTSAVALRRTRVVLFELIRGARSRITLVSYAAFRQDDLVEELRSAAGRGVQVRLVLESAAASRGRLDDDAARAFSTLEGTVEVLEWPSELRGDGKISGVLHAKAVVVDGSVALVSSANLTAAALDHNMELGLLVRGGGIPRRLEEHVTELRAKGILRPVLTN